MHRNNFHINEPLRGGALKFNLFLSLSDICLRLRSQSLSLTRFLSYSFILSYVMKKMCVYMCV